MHELRSTGEEPISWNSTTQWTESEAENLESDFIACQAQELRSRPGLFTYVSDGTKELCSLYIAAPIDHVIEMEFIFLDVDCDSDSDVGSQNVFWRWLKRHVCYRDGTSVPIIDQVEIFDGWELDDQIFPSSKDHTDPLPMRYISLCDRSSTHSRYLAKQNIAQVQFIVPTVGQGFRVKVNFPVNYQPCNMMLLSNHYKRITVRNYGLQRNCTVLSLYPQAVQIMYMNIGETDRDKLFSPSRSEMSSGIRTLCRSLVDGEDSVQLYEGTGVGSENWKLVFGICGARQTVAPRTIQLRCHSSAVRLQSSGEFFNVVQFAFLPGEGDDENAC